MVDTYSQPPACEVTAMAETVHIQIDRSCFICSRADRPLLHHLSFKFIVIYIIISTHPLRYYPHFPVPSIFNTHIQMSLIKYNFIYICNRKLMASIRNSYEKVSVKERISQLYQKINTIEPKQHESKRKYESIQSMCDQLEEQINQFTLLADERLVDIKHKTNKISKEMKKNYGSFDTAVRQQIADCNQRLMMLLDQQSEIARENSIAMLQYVEQEASNLQSDIEKEGVDREEEGRLIEESLTADIQEITKSLDEVSAGCREKLKKTESELYSKTENLSTKLHDICTAYSDNQAEFYKMLRDLVKKVKSQLSEHQAKREETEAQILNLIDRMCDSKISKGN